MERIKKNIMEGFAGKVGPVIGSHWKGILFMRKKPEKGFYPFM